MPPSSISGDAARAEIRENALVTGNPVKDSNKFPITTGANAMYMDSNSALATGPALPLTVTSAMATTTSLLSLSAATQTGSLTNTFVASAQVTTATIAGYIRITVTDTAGNLTTGGYYMPIYTIA